MEKETLDAYAKNMFLFFDNAIVRENKGKNTRRKSEYVWFFNKMLEQQTGLSLGDWEEYFRLAG